VTKPVEERRAIAAKYEHLQGAQCADLRKALKTALMLIRERDRAMAKMGTTLQRMHNNFRAMKRLPPQARPKRDDTRDRRLLAEIRRVCLWWGLR
jgi:hypothetical protein